MIPRLPAWDFATNILPFMPQKAKWKIRSLKRNNKKKTENIKVSFDSINDGFGQLNISAAEF